MYMRSVLARSTLMAVVACCLSAIPALAGPDKFDIDPVHSMVFFKVEHLGVSNNYGRFNDISGSYTFDEAKPAASSFDVTIKAESVDTHSDKRDQHLRSPDFFNAKQFPVITFKSKCIKKSGDKRYAATGTLQMHGVEKEITVDIEHIGSGDDPWGNFRSGFETVFTVKRSEFGMKYMLGGIGDEVTVHVNIEGIAKKAE